MTIQMRKRISAACWTASFCLSWAVLGCGVHALLPFIPEDWRWHDDEDDVSIRTSISIAAGLALATWLFWYVVETRRELRALKSAVLNVASCGITIPGDEFSVWSSRRDSWYKRDIPMSLILECMPYYVPSAGRELAVKYVEEITHGAYRNTYESLKENDTLLHQELNCLPPIVEYRRYAIRVNMLEVLFQYIWCKRRPRIWKSENESADVIGWAKAVLNSLFDKKGWEKPFAEGETIYDRENIERELSKL